jgi:nucleoside-diphosphate-sugar epimerase
MKALIGYTGFVGSNLIKQHYFHKKYNSSNINEIQNEKFNLIVCAGVSGTKWIANKYPDEDLKKIRKLLSNLSRVKCKKFILISTVDVYRKPHNVYENTPIETEGLHHYGKNRVLVEEFVKENFQDYHIIRLPAIYGDNIKKNFVFDLLNNHCLEWTHKDSVFQFYYLKNLWKDIEKVIENNIKLINFNSEPISARELAKECFNVEFNNITERPPADYNVKSIFSYLYNKDSCYMYSKNQVFKEMKEFIKSYTDNK